MQELDLKGMTLAELRRVNTQLDTDRLTENEALRTEYLATQASYSDASSTANNDYELRIGQMIAHHRESIDEVDESYKRLGADIGILMDRRKFCETSEDYDMLRQQIDEAMDKRREIRTQRHELKESFHKELHELKEEHRKTSRARSQEHEATLREYRKARIAIAKKYAKLHEEVRKEIALRKAEEHEQDTTSAD